MGKGVIRFYEPDSEYGYLSNWYMSDFMYAGRRYHSMEQYMMFQKALTFGDLEIADKIMASRDLPEIKKLGRSVATTCSAQAARCSRNARPEISSGVSVWTSRTPEAVTRRSGRAATC